MTEQVVPIAQARSRLSQIVKMARYGRRPVLIGSRGRAEVAVIDVDLYRALQERIEEVLDVDDARAALEEYARGEGRDAADVFSRLDERVDDRHDRV